MLHHFYNEMFYRKFVNIWENNLIEDFDEELKNDYDTRFFLDILAVVQYFNFHEWMTLWRLRGEIIPPN